jgi:hypothetical protein
MMITDHQFLGRREWGFHPPAVAPCQHDGCGAAKDQHARGCTAVLVLDGQQYGCDLITPHPCLHRNEQLRAAW